MIMTSWSTIRGNAGFETEFNKPQNLFEVKGCCDALSHFNTPPHVRISFLGDGTGLPILIQGGLGFVNLKVAEQNISAFWNATRV